MILSEVKVNFGFVGPGGEPNVVANEGYAEDLLVVRELELDFLVGGIFASNIEPALEVGLSLGCGGGLGLQSDFASGEVVVDQLVEGVVAERSERGR